MRTTDFDSKKVIELVKTYRGKYMAEVRAYYKESGDHDTYVNFGSNANIATNRAIEEAEKDGYYKGISNGNVTYFKWSNYKKLYVTRAKFSY